MAAEAGAAAYQEIELASNSEVLCFRPVGATSADNVLTLVRSTGQFIQHDTTSSHVGLRSLGRIYGIVGLIRLLRGLYVIAIADRSLVGRIGDHQIWQLKRVSMIPLREHATSLTPHQQSDENEYLELLNSQFNDIKAWYYSYTMDITRSLQELMTSDASSSGSLWRYADPLFFWNHFLVKDMRNHELDGWIIPMIRGFCEILPAKINSQTFSFALITRGSCKRAGTRFNMRGVDEQGNVANFSETEQIVIASDGTIVSLVQLRGSIPVFWNQYANLKYKPKLTIEKTGAPKSKRQLGFVNHMRYLLDRYNKIYAVNLVNQHGSEKTLANEFQECVRDFAHDNLKYTAFDFHKECKNMRFDRVDILVRKVQPELDEFGYLFRNSDGSFKQTQQGVFRINCIDSLDRTNVVQSAFGKFVLRKQLVELGIMKSHEQLDEHKQFIGLFNNCWADNADAMSVLYAGTGALKTDFTRVGTRTYGGILNDGYNAVMRYFLNNFRDGRRQDAMNLLLGQFVPDASLPSPFRDHSNLKLVNFSLLSFGLVTGLIMTLANVVFLVRNLTSESSNPGHRILFIVAWTSFLWITYMLLIRNGRDFVDKPRLIEPKKLI